MKHNVKLGARLMDIFRPGWYREIERQHFDMALGWDCILGQLYKRQAWGCQGVLNGYEYFMNAYGRSMNWATKYGFMIPLGTPTRDCEEEYKYLTALWLNEIHDRLNA